MNLAIKNSTTETATTQENTDWKLSDVISGDCNKLYKIDQNTPLYFKLMDNTSLTKNIREKLKSNPEFSALFNEQLEFITRQKNQELWVKLDEQIIKMTLLDLYHAFLRSLKDKSYEDQLFNVNDVSFMGPLGPFSQMPLIQCLNDRLINKFIFSHIIQNKLPARNMRLITEGEVIVSYGKQMDLVSKLNVKQITDTGILFSTQDEYVIEDMSKSEVVQFYMTSEHIQKFADNNFQSKHVVKDLFYTEDELRYFYVEESKLQRGLSYRSDETNEFFLFVRYFDMLESDIPNVFMGVMEKLKDYFKFLANS